MKKPCFPILFPGIILGSTLGFLGGWYWFFDLFNHFRFQSTALLLVTLLFLLLSKRFKKAALASIAFIPCFWPLLPYLPHQINNAHTYPTHQIRILYANVYVDNQEHDKLIQLIREKNPDIVVLLEINQRWSAHLQENLSDFPVQKVTSREDCFGIALFSKMPLEISTEHLSSIDTPSFRCVGEISNKKFVLWVTHPLPPIGQKNWHLRNEHLGNLAGRIAREKESVVVVGDLNTSAWTYGFSQLRKERLQDSAEGLGFQPTWPSMWPQFMRVPIDHILHSQEIKILELKVLNNIGSDHFPLYVRLQL